MLLQGMCGPQIGSTQDTAEEGSRPQERQGISVLPMGRRSLCSALHVFWELDALACMLWLALSHGLSARSKYFWQPECWRACMAVSWALF